MKSLFKWARLIICLRNLNIKHVRDVLHYCINCLVCACGSVSQIWFKNCFFNWAGLTETTCDGGPVSLPLLVVVARLVDLQQAPDPLHLGEQESATSSDRVDLEKTWALSFLQMVFSSWVQLLQRVLYTEGTSRLFAFLYFQGFLTPAPRPWGK